ncbi:hypothetical protein NLU13_3822 [Sarocladium strictum]|uniref:Signal peptide-containing protein n=1 Tax=Sarocladium strictum TaxID=5046 RepID=A0AA39GI34_SARSR|nr:hypothetical protein NLU13_3822 [Sarocladium strictum]
MSLPIAFRSAVFYFVACTPCAKVRHRQKARDKAKKERLEKERLEKDQPDRYHHPSPFNTNPHWQEEIDLGPSLPKKSASKNSSQRGLTSSCTDTSTQNGMSDHHSHAGGSRMHVGDGTVTTGDEDEDGKLSDDWNRRRGYQREDEELWGQWSGNKIMDAFSKAKDSAGRLIDATLGIDKEMTEVSEQARRDFYFSPKNPPVNDYHPPVVSSKAPVKDAHRWMLQPPPPAKVMEGKVPVNRAVSSGSKSSGRTLVGEEVQLGRLVHEKLVKERLKKDTSPTESELIDSLFVTRSNGSLSFQRSRSFSLDGSEESLEHTLEWNRRSRLRPVAAPPKFSDDEEDTENIAALRPQSSANPTTTTRAAQRPKLETISSSGSFASSGKSSRKHSQRQKSSKIRSISGAASPVGDDTE